MNSPQTITGRLMQPPRYYADGFLIGKLQSDDGTAHTIKGDMPEPGWNEQYELFGEWTEYVNKRTGLAEPQFSFSSYRLILPTAEYGIRRYLSQTMKWVGEVTAKALVDAYGTKTLDVIRDEPERVAVEIKGINLSRAQEMSALLGEDAELAEVRVQLETILAGQRLPRKAVHKLIEKYGKNAPLVLRDDPYRLIELPGVGFKTADQIAVTRLNYPPDGDHRRAAAMTFVMQEAANGEGHTYLRMSQLAERVRKLIGYEPNLGSWDLVAGSVEVDGDWVMLDSIACAERECASRIRRLLEHTPRHFEIDMESLSEDQRDAFATISGSNVALLTGKPGTGKTFTLAKIIEAARRAGLNVVVCAPTGKAAKRASEALKGLVTATTIHRALGATYNDQTGEFSWAHSRNNPIPCDLLVVDELSMVGIELLSSLLQAVPDNARVLFVGDPHQLQSVGAGAVLRDMIRGGLPHAQLTEIKRNAGAVQAAVHAISNGEEPEFPAALDIDAGDNLRFIECGEDDIHNAILGSLDSLSGHGFDRVWDVQPMSPLNEKGSFSVKPLCELLGPELNSSVGKGKFRKGDKVIRCKNGSVPGRYVNEDDAEPNAKPGEVNVVNGDGGCVEEVRAKEIVVRHWFPERVAIYPMNEHHLREAWALTVHKMQGSSAPAVIIPLHRSFIGPIWSREWLYTAISRAERACILIGDRGMLRRAISRVRYDERQTTLADRLQAAEVAA